MSWFTHNWRLKLLALFVSLPTWAVVVYAGNPPQSEVIKAIQVEHGPPPHRLVLLREPAPVNVTISGLQSSLAAFKKESLHAFVDLARAKQGRTSLPVRIENSDRTVTVRGAPPPVDVDLDEQASATQKVLVRLKNPSSCCDIGTPTASPDSVTLQGPQSLLAAAVAVATVDITDRQVTAQLTVPVKVESATGKPLDQLTANPSVVQVSVVIKPLRIQREVAILPQLTGTPARGFVVVNLLYSPLTATVAGDPAEVSTLAHLDTDPVDISGAQSDVFTTVTLRLPSGVTLISKGPFNVHVVIQAAPGPESSPRPSSSPSP